MGLETGTQIGDLVAGNPAGTDPKAQGDDHLRLIKTCVQGSLGLMDTLWGIKGNDNPLKGETTTPGTYRNLIGLNPGGEVEISEAAIKTNVLGALDITGSLTASGALVIESGGAAITGTLTLAGGANITGAVNILGGNNLALSSGSDMTLAGGGITATQTAGGGECSFRAVRSGTSSSFVFCGENLDAALSYRPVMGIFHDDDGDIIIGETQSEVTFQIKENTIRLGSLPIGAAGLSSGDLYRGGVDNKEVFVNL